MVELNKVKANGKSIVLDNGIELTYCELGEEHEEVVLSAAFYHHTWYPVLEGLAERYHVYGIVMRIDGEKEHPDQFTQFLDSGEVDWPNQWGEDVYNFSQKLGLTKFHYVGKCHSTQPGWWLIKNHPEVLYDFCSFYLAPHILERSDNEWTNYPKRNGAAAFSLRCMRKESGVAKKAEEMKTLGPSASASPAVAYMAERPELLWSSAEECKKTLSEISLPVMLVFGTEDLLFHDWYDSNLAVMQLIPRVKTVLIQGERHLMEMDCPKRMAREALFFMDENRLPDC